MLKSSKPRPLTAHWAAMKEFDEGMYEKCTAWRDALTYNATLPLREKEMIMIAMTCLARFEAGIRTHVRYGLAEGLTRDEIIACATLPMLIGGIPVFSEGIKTVLDELDKIKKEGGSK